MRVEDTPCVAGTHEIDGFHLPMLVARRDAAAAALPPMEHALAGMEYLLTIKRRGPSVRSIEHAQRLECDGLFLDTGGWRWRLVQARGQHQQETTDHDAHHQHRCQHLQKRTDTSPSSRRANREGREILAG